MSSSLPQSSYGYVSHSRIAIHNIEYSITIVIFHYISLEFNVIPLQVLQSLLFETIYNVLGTNTSGTSDKDPEEGRNVSN
jgi:hypothetical protein